MSIENLKKMSNADLLIKQFKKIKKKKDDAEAASKRIPEDLKKALKNRKGIKFKKKISEIILGGPAKKKKKEEKDKIGKAMDVKMELIKTPEFKNKPKEAYKLATKLDKSVPGGIKPDLDKQKLKNFSDRFLKKPSKPIFRDRDPDIMVRPPAFQAELDPRRKNMGGKLTKTKPVTMNMGGQVDGVEDLTTEIEVID